ncbi:Sodium/glutamate symport carrier protein [compost metagenome]
MELNVVEVLALSGFALFFGTLIHKWVPFTAKYSLPSSVLGGLSVAFFLYLIEKIMGAPIRLDTSAQTPLMVAFFTGLGFGASWKALKAGGKKVIWFLTLAIGLLFVQDIVGVLVALGLGQHPLFGVLTSSVSLVGGPGTALAFADLFQQNGVDNAAAIGLSTAMGGILFAGMVGGPVSTFLIEKYKLHGQGQQRMTPLSPDEQKMHVLENTQINFTLLKHVVLILVVMALGRHMGNFFESLGVTFPIYIGAMVVAAIFRNFDDWTDKINMDEQWIDAVGSAALSLFIAMSLMSLEWSKLSDMAGPMVIALLVQGLVVVGLSATVIFKMYGKSYESAVLAGGMVGFMMGTTANAMANLEAVTKRYGPAPFAYFIIPLVGSCFVDFANAAVIAVFINIFR